MTFSLAVDRDRGVVTHSALCVATLYSHNS